MDKQVEQIFAYAVALDQSGKMKNTILCKDREIFIVNFDKTILLSFVLHSNMEEFKQEVSFYANDYDSPNFRIENGKIIFKTVSNGYVREKTCGTNKSLSFDQVSTLYYRLSRKKTTHSFKLRQAIMSMMQDDLSHVEISYNKGIQIVQRDIFSGTTLSIKNDESGLNLSQDKLFEFDPIGIRTVDLDALFQRDEELVFNFIPKMNYFVVSGKITGLRAILGACLYDELGTIETIKGS